MTLGDWFSRGPIERNLKKGFSGGPYVIFSEFVSLEVLIYELGAIIGRARRDKLQLLAWLFAELPKGNLPFYEEFEQALGFSEFLKTFTTIAHSQAQQRLEKYASMYGAGRVPSSFTMLVMATAFERSGVVLPFHGVSGSSQKTIKKAAALRVPFDETFNKLRMIFLQEGIGFGSRYPSLTEAMWRRTHEDINCADWEDAKLYGFSQLGQSFELCTLEEVEWDCMSLVAQYAKEYAPNFVNLLDLEEFLT